MISYLNNEILSHYEIVSQNNEIVSHYYEIVSHNNEIQSHYYKIVSQNHETGFHTTQWIKELVKYLIWHPASTPDVLLI